MLNSQKQKDPTIARTAYLFRVRMCGGGELQQTIVVLSYFALLTLLTLLSLLALPTVDPLERRATGQ